MEKFSEEEKLPLSPASQGTKVSFDTAVVPPTDFVADKNLSVLGEIKVIQTLKDLRISPLSNKRNMTTLSADDDNNSKTLSYTSQALAHDFLPTQKIDLILPKIRIRVPKPLDKSQRTTGFHYDLAN